jgi:hypothetical protein
VDAFVALADDPGLSDVDRGSVQSRLMLIATLQVRARSRCAESFEAAPGSDVVQGGSVEMLAPAGAECGAFRFGMALLRLTNRTSKQIGQLTKSLEARFGEPSVRFGEGLKTLRWQVSEGRAVEVEYAAVHPERRTAGVTLANVPDSMRPQAGAAGQRL